MVDFCTGDREYIAFLYRDAFFDKSLEDLRAMGGEAFIIARKVDEFVDLLLNPDHKGNREKFRFTRNKEARIKNCKKVDLGCGYRLVCIKKDGHLALLYLGTHDDCFRWIERNRGMTYDFHASSKVTPVIHESTVCQENIPAAVLAEQRVVEEYEARFMSRLDDTILRKIFSGLCGMQPREINAEA